MSVDRCAEIRSAPFSGLTEHCTVCKEGAGKRGLESGLTEYCTVCREGAGKRGLESGLTEYRTVCREGAGKRGLESGLTEYRTVCREGAGKRRLERVHAECSPSPPPTPRSSCTRPTAYTTCDYECFSKCSPLLKQQTHLAETSAYHVSFSVQGVDLSSTKITQKPARRKGYFFFPISENLRRC